MRTPILDISWVFCLTDVDGRALIYSVEARKASELQRLMFDSSGRWKQAKPAGTRPLAGALDVILNTKRLANSLVCI